MSRNKEIYEALQAVNACLDETGEQLLVDLVEKIKDGVSRDGCDGCTGAPTVWATLHQWIRYDARYDPEV
jgi:hypothetical protein